MGISIILPAKNEAEGLAIVLPKLKAAWPDAEIIVVDDGSTDGTKALCKDLDVLVLSNPYSMGNGAAVKRGARAASGESARSATRAAFEVFRTTRMDA